MSTVAYVHGTVGLLLRRAVEPQRRRRARAPRRKLRGAAGQCGVRRRRVRLRRPRLSRLRRLDRAAPPLLPRPGRGDVVRRPAPRLDGVLHRLRVKRTSGAVHVRLLPGRPLGARPAATAGATARRRHRHGDGRWGLRRRALVLVDARGRDHRDAAALRRPTSCWPTTTCTTCTGGPSDVFRAPYAAALPGLFDMQHYWDDILAGLPPTSRELLQPAYFNAGAEQPGHPMRVRLRQNAVDRWRPRGPDPRLSQPDGRRGPVRRRPRLGRSPPARGGDITLPHGVRRSREQLDPGASARGRVLRLVRLTAGASDRARNCRLGAKFSADSSPNPTVGGLPAAQSAVLIGIGASLASWVTCWGPSSSSEVTPSSRMVRSISPARISITRSTPASPPAISPYR